MIYRYELLVPPKGKILFKLESLARDKGFDEYAQTFRDAIWDEFAVELPGIAPSPTELLFASITGVPVSGPTTPEQKMMHDALQALMYQSEWPGPKGAEARMEMKSVRRCLRRVHPSLGSSGPSGTLSKS